MTWGVLRHKKGESNRKLCSAELIMVTNVQFASHQSPYHSNSHGLNTC